MKKIKAIFCALLTIMLFSCSTNDNESPSTKPFRFLEFEKNVLIPSANPRDILILGTNFDSNLSVWEITLTNESDTVFESTISSVTNTGYGFMNNEKLQKIYVKIPALEAGNYSMTFKNTKINQIYSETFLIRDQVFENIVYDHVYTYNYGSENSSIDHLYFFPNAVNYIDSKVNTNNIKGLYLESQKDLQKTELNYAIEKSGKISFIIPKSVAIGRYYLSIEYNNSLNNYYQKEVVLIEGIEPEVISINKTKFKGGETIILTGKNLRYNMKFSVLPIQDLFLSGPISGILFKSASGERNIYFSPYPSDPTYNSINSSGTEVRFDIPIDKFFVSDREATYYEGEITFFVGPFKTKSFPIRIDYK